MVDCICEQCQFDRLWNKLDSPRLRTNVIIMKRDNAKLIDIWDVGAD